MANLATSPKFLGAFCRWQFWMWESKIWGRWVSWFISCGHGTVSHQLQFSADLLQKWRDILWSKFANVSLMFFATYLQIFIPFYLVVLAAVTFLHITESPCSFFWVLENLHACYGYLMRSKKLKFEGGVPDGGQSKNQDWNPGLPFDIKKVSSSKQAS